MYYNTIEELKQTYEYSDMTEEELRLIINDSTKSYPENCYHKLLGNSSGEKAKILMKIWQKIKNPEIY